MREPDAMLGSLPAIAAALAGAVAKLKHAGVPDAGGDARRLLAAALGVPGAHLLAHPEQVLTAEQAAGFARLLERRRAREPVSRILGEREFYGRPFMLSPATLDPRPDSETLIDTALDIAGSAGLRTAPLRLLDIGTGSGCLLVTLLCELPNATGVGTDISPAALEVARENARRLGVVQRASWQVADALHGVEGRFDLLVCNPPYVRSGDIAALEPEVRAFDPRTALDGGSDGLDIYRRLAPHIPAVCPRGWALLEVGYDQADAVANVLASSATMADASAFTFRCDVTGIRRCVAWRTRAEA
jgi:release factor glutamine methyltransferase